MADARKERGSKYTEAWSGLGEETLDSGVREATLNHQRTQKNGSGGRVVSEPSRKKGDRWSGKTQGRA